MGNMQKDHEIIGKLLDKTELLGITRPEDRGIHYYDIFTCHTSGNALPLRRMIEWGRPSDLAHDIFGINKHLDRETGELLDCFSPRFSA